MDGEIVALHRYPIKGFSPEPVSDATLEVGGPFPNDRLFAVENGPSGFDPDAPKFIPKRRFAVLARSALVASVHTRFDEADITARRRGARSSPIFRKRRRRGRSRRLRRVADAGPSLPTKVGRTA